MFTKKQSEVEYIGEVYLGKCYKGSWGLYPAHQYPDASYLQWIRFTKETRDIFTDHDEYISIFGKCHKRENVIFYDSIYDIKRNKIEKRIKGLREKHGRV